MMKMQAFRVTEVLVGHSAAAALVGVDGEGREVRLEVPAIDAAAVQPGLVLVLGWMTARVPELAARGPTTSTAASTATATTAADELMETGAYEPVDELGILTETGALAARDDEGEHAGVLAEFRALMGLG